MVFWKTTNSTETGLHIDIKLGKKKKEKLARNEALLALYADL